MAKSATRTSSRRSMARNATAQDKAKPEAVTPEAHAAAAAAKDVSRDRDPKVTGHLPQQQPGMESMPPSLPMAKSRHSGSQQAESGRVDATGTQPSDASRAPGVYVSHAGLERYHQSQHAFSPPEHQPGPSGQPGQYLNPPNVVPTNSEPPAHPGQQPPMEGAQFANDTPGRPERSGDERSYANASANPPETPVPGVRDKAAYSGAGAAPHIPLSPYPPASPMTAGYPPYGARPPVYPPPPYSPYAMYPPYPYPPHPYYPQPPGHPAAYPPHMYTPQHAAYQHHPHYPMGPPPTPQHTHALQDDKQGTQAPPHSADGGSGVSAGAPGTSQAMESPSRAPQFVGQQYGMFPPASPMVPSPSQTTHPGMPPYQGLMSPPPPGVKYPPMRTGVDFHREPDVLAEQENLDRHHSGTAESSNGISGSTVSTTSEMDPSEDGSQSQGDPINGSSSRVKIYVKPNRAASEEVRARRARKNSQSRARAARHRQRIMEIEAKPPSERNAEEVALYSAYEQRRKRKNNRSRERAQERKEEIDRILSLPESKRTRIEIQYLETALSAKKRKNEGDRLRRHRMKILGLPHKGKLDKPGVTARGPLPAQFQYPSQVPHEEGLYPPPSGYYPPYMSAPGYPAYGHGPPPAGTHMDAPPQSPGGASAAMF